MSHPTKRRLNLFSISLLIITLVLSRETSYADTLSPEHLNGPSARTIANPIASPINAQQAADELENYLAQVGSGRVTLMLEVEGNPAIFAGRDAAGSYIPADILTRLTQQAHNQKTQAALTAELEKMGGRVLGSTQLVFNGLLIEADASQVAAIQALPAVRTLFPDTTFEMENGASVNSIGSAVFWQNTGLTGQNIRIGIIDSGVDYYHRTFGGAGVYPAAGTLNSTTLADGGFPNAKVVGGTDFVGNVFPTMAPDPDPLDCMPGTAAFPAPHGSANSTGHGTSVAATAAGFGSIGATTYAGVYGQATSNTTFTVGPGVAPNAQIYALKVAWCDLVVSNIATTQALEFAVTNGLHVVNLSLGAPYGAAADMTSMATEATAAAGVIVVAAAGNAGDTFFINDSPGASPRVISVASAQDVVTVNYSGGSSGILAARPALFGPHLNNTGPLTAPLIYTNPPLACPNTSLPITNAPGTPWIALIDRGGTPAAQCSFQQKVLNAQAQGAIGVIIANNAAGNPIKMPGTVNVSIPAIMVSQADGNILKAALAGGAITVTLRGTSTGDLLAASSSRGPAIAPNGPIILKPDLTAPGVEISSARYGGGSTAISRSGTSFAAPHITGVMALLRQRYPSLSVAQLKALVMNTATTDVFDLAGGGATADQYSPTRVGAGRVDLLNVVAGFNFETIAFNATNPEQVSVSFGAVGVAGATTLTRNITLQNFSNNNRSYSTSFDTITDVSGVTITVAPATVNVPAGGTATVTVTLNATVAAMTQPNTPDPTLAQTQVGDPRHWLAEEAGYVVFVPIQLPGPNLRVPVYSAPRPSSTMLAATNPLVLGNLDVGTIPLSLTGTGVNTGGTYPYDVISLVAPFELVQESADEADAQAYENHADIQYVGITSDYRTVGTIANTRLFFAISTYGEWNTLGGGSYFNGVFPNNFPVGNPFRFQGTPGEASFEVWFDTNGDNTPDFALVTWDLGDYEFTTGVANSPNTDVFISVLVNLNTGAINGTNQGYVNVLPADTRTTYPFNTNVLILPVDAADLGLTDANPILRYQVRGYSIPTARVSEPAGYIDAAPAAGFAQYNVAAPVYSFTDTTGSAGGPFSTVLTYEDLPGAAIPVDFNVTGLVNPLPCILLIHHQNVSGTRPERVCPSKTPTTGQPTSDLAISKVGSLETGGVGLPGETLSWVITLTNVTAQPFTNLTITDTIIPELRVVSATTTSGTATINGQTVTFNIPTLAAGQTIQMRIVTTVESSPASGVFVNEATVVAGTISRTAHAEVNAATGLPNTGYPPKEKNTDWRLELVIGAVLAVLGLMAFGRHRRRMA